MDLLEAVAARVDMKYRLRLVKDGRYGSMNPINGSWNGIIGELIRGVSMITPEKFVITVDTL